VGNQILQQNPLVREIKKSSQHFSIHDVFTQTQKLFLRMSVGLLVGRAGESSLVLPKDISGVIIN
jgi:hypothetical protein